MAARKFTQKEWTEETDQSEEYLVRHIRTYLLTEGERVWLFKMNLSVEDVLNGRFPINMMGEIKEKLFKPWNDKLGWTEFGRNC